MAEVTLETRGSVEHIRLDRAEQRNALTSEMVVRLTELIGESEARAIVISGAGSAFSAGADLAEYTVGESGESNYAHFAVSLDALCARIAEHPAPVIAAMNGPALGGGATLALACDIRIADPRATLGIPAARLGIVLGFANILRVFLMVGPSLAADMLLAARVLDADELCRFGIATEVVDEGSVEPEAIALAERISRLAPLSISAHKKAIRGLMAPPPWDALASDIDERSKVAFSSKDLQEGIAAFGEKRLPDFAGE